MSNYSKNYSSYLGSKRCCNLNTQGPAGPQGPTGFGGLGPRGYTGPPGESFTGPTGRGCRGPTGPSGGPIGPTGPTGPNLWDIGSFTIEKSSGSTGISGIGYTGNVLIYGDLNVTGVIDPTSIIIGGTGPNSMVLDSENNTFRIIGNTGGMIYSGLNTSFQYISFLPRVLAALDLPPDPSNATVLYVNNTILFEDSSGSAIIGLDNSGNLLIDPSNSLIFNGNLDMSLNNITRVSNISNTANITIDPSNTLFIAGTLDMSKNVIRDASGIFFSDGSYIGDGGSFDISSNQVLVLNGKQDPSGNYNGSSIVAKDRIYQQLYLSDASWNSVNGYLGLSKDAYPALNPSSSGVQAVSTWTNRTFPITFQGQGICWSPELKLFVAVSDISSNTTNIATSPDGINWTIQTTPAGTNSWKSVAWSKELNLFTAVASGGIANSNVCRIMTSPNGITWTQQTSNTVNNLRNILWSKELGQFVVVGFGSSSVDNPYRFQTSTDGITWTKRQSAVILTNCNGSSGSSIITCDNTSSLRIGMNLSILTGSVGTFSSTAYVNSITNSTTFTINSTIATALSNSTLLYDNNWQGACWSAELGLLVAVSTTGPRYGVSTSTDGINWTFRPTGILLTNCNNTIDPSNVTCNSTAELVVGMNIGLVSGSGIMSFPSVNSIIDSTTFRTSAAISGLSNTTLVANSGFRSVCWSKELGIFVAVGDGGGQTNRAMTSPDGINWTLQTTPNTDWQSVCWSPELRLFVATAPSAISGQQIMTSPNGINWTLITNPTSILRSICWSPELGIFAVASQDSRALTSSLAGRPPTSYNVFDSSFNNIDSNGNWTLKSKSIFSDGNITIDPSNTLFVAGTLDMSLNNISNVSNITSTSNITIDPSNTLFIAGDLDMSLNNITNVASIEIDNGTNNALLTIDGTGNLLIDPSLNLVVGTNSSLTLQPTNNLPTTLVPYGLYINSPSIKTYPTTASFASYPAYYTNLEFGTSQDISANGFNTVYGDYRNYTKSAGTTTDIERLNFGGLYQQFTWDDANTCKQYVGFSDNFNYNGKNANNKTSNTFNVNTIALNCPASSTQTISNITARGALRVSANNTNSIYYITNSVSPSLSLGGTTTDCSINITNHSFFENSSLCNLTGAGSSATITNMYGLRLNFPTNTTGLTITNNWGVYSGWSLAKNYFAGGVGIGTTTINNALDISGNATISTSLRVPQITNTGNITIDPSNTLIVLGDVGIGKTPDPSFNLDVSGNTKITNSLQLSTASTNCVLFNPNTGFTVPVFVNDSYHTILNGQVEGTNGGTGQLAIGGKVKANTAGANFNTCIGYGSAIRGGVSALAVGRNCVINSNDDANGYNNNVAIGSNINETASGIITINASGNTLAASIASSFYVDPIRNSSPPTFLGYNATTKEITYSNTITSTGNLTIDPSNTLIVLGNVDVSGGYFSRGVPVTKTGDFTVQTNENWIICNGSGTITVTLPTSSSFPGRELMFKNIAAQLVNSSASNVVPLVGGAASTAILPGTAGSTATLVSDGTNWIIMQ